MRPSPKPYDWLTQNSKIKKMRGVKTYNWGIPAYRAANGFATCPMAGACAKGCYATQGAYTFSNVKPAFERRLALARDPDRFVPTIDAELKRRGIQRVRVHDSGDFFSPKYLDAWLTVMRLNPDVRFYAYTKMVGLLKLYQSQNKIPPNFTVIFSYGGKQDVLIDPSTDRHSRVFGSVRELRAAGYANATKDDAVAAQGSSHKIGLVYHGTKNLENTDWASVRVPDAAPAAAA
jgi:hypothetical protein